MYAYYEMCEELKIDPTQYPYCTDKGHAKVWTLWMMLIRRELRAAREEGKPELLVSKPKTSGSHQFRFFKEVKP